MERENIVTYFLESCEKYPDSPSLFVKKEIYTYRELYVKASALALTLDVAIKRQDPYLTAILASRSATAYASIIATLLRGYGYVPLSDQYPPERISYILNNIECKSMIVDGKSVDLIRQVLPMVEESMVVLLPELEDVNELRDEFRKHIILGKGDIEEAIEYQMQSYGENSIAYIIYTSGTTGVPKGVMVTHKNVITLIDYMSNKLEIEASDRISHTFSLTFDPSVFDMFITWNAGATLFCLSKKELLNPASFIKKNELTVWHSVPSLVTFMKRLGGLKEGNFPTLRISLLGGEPLTVDVATMWAMAAPNSIIENLYGPTETTINISAYRWNSKKSPTECYRGVVPIGYTHKHVSYMICDENLKEVEPGKIGELLVAGSQVTLGYWKDPDRTAKAFIIPPGKKEIYYRTGDLVKKDSEDAPIQYIGRIDSQIKVLGQRVELGEIEAVIREESGLTAVIAVGWPITGSGAEGIEVFIEGENVDVQELMGRISGKLPKYMMPKRIHVIPQIPLNVSGKYDRKALIKILEED